MHRVVLDTRQSCRRVLEQLNRQIHCVTCGGTEHHETTPTALTLFFNDFPFFSMI